MLSPSEIAAMRSAQAAAMPDTVTIQRPARVDDGAAGQTETWATVATTAGRLASAGSASEQAIAGRLGVITPYRVTLPAETDVTARDRLVIGGRTFEIVSAPAGGAWETARVCLCKEIL